MRFEETGEKKEKGRVKREKEKAFPRLTKKLPCARGGVARRVTIRRVTEG